MAEAKPEVYLNSGPEFSYDGPCPLKINIGEISGKISGSLMKSVSSERTSSFPVFCRWCHQSLSVSNDQTVSHSSVLYGTLLNSTLVS